MPFALLLAVGSSFASETYVHIWTESTDFSNANRVIDLYPAQGQLTASMAAPDMLFVNYLSNDHSGSWSFEFSPPAGQALGPGRYDDAASPVSRQPDQPGLGISGGPLDCSPITGTFEVLRLETNGSSVTSFWAKFEQSCVPFSGITRGEIRYQVDSTPYVDAPLTVAMQRTDGFTAGVAAWGFPDRAPVLQAGGIPAGAVFKDSGDGTANLYWTPGFTQGGAYDVAVHADDGLGRSADATMRLDVGGVTSVLLEGDPGPIYQGLREFYTPRDADLFGHAVILSNISLSYVELAFRSNRLGFRAQFAGADGTLPRAGSYENVAAVGRQGPGQAGIQITANAQQCSNLTGRFDIRQVEYGPFDLVRRFWATFEVHCEGLPQALRGEVRLNADVPVWLIAPARETTVAGTSVGFPLTAFSMTPGPIAIEASGLPASASFLDFGDGTGGFLWTPLGSDLGPTRVTFTARDSQNHPDSLATDITVFEPNDELDHAVPIPVALPFRTTLDPFWASRAVDDPDCGYAGNDTVWYAFTPAADTRLDIDTVGSNVSTVIGVFTGTRGALTQVACGASAVLNLPVAAGVTYSIMTGTSERGGHLSLSVAVAPPVPANDDFDAATPIASLPFAATENILLATHAPDDPFMDCPGNAQASNPVWFSFTAPRDMRVIANAKGSDFPALLAAFDGTRGALRALVCDDAILGPPPQIELDLFAGVTYYFMASFMFQPLNTGNLSFLLVPVLEVGIAIDPTAVVSKESGTATLQGSVTCSRPIAFDFTLDLGKDSPGVPHATAIVSVVCNDTARWSAILDPRPGPPFRHGRVPASARARLSDARTNETLDVRTDTLVRLSPREGHGRSGG